MTRLGYEASGDVERPAILFLHGFMGSSGDWKAVAAALEEQFYCVAVDLPGHGASVGLPPESYTVEGATRSLVDLLDELAIERAVAVGYSMGGRLALFLALRYPERCAGLFLESASPGLESTAERTARRKSDEEKARRLESENFERFLRDWYRQPLFASLARHEELLQQTIEARRRNEPRELARSLWGELAGLRLPTLAVAGTLDGKYVGVSRCMATLSPKLRATVVPGAGHNVRVELTKEYITLLRGFLDTDDLS
ncbi:MAG: 2-succinyl-6-hydroxy-2,4-cyclohexadiene-1-carboxylate synthase [Actinomycetota bacterium]|nr:2-succinyl-6-hydroxy-2,4-cyclohexadiene-1-carboxylate synthase [Actinomycetota bacterium]